MREYFVCTEEGWIHHRANKEIAKADEKSEKASASAKARWNKKDANALPTLSESNATHNTLPITQDTEHKTQKKATVVARPTEVSEQTWNDWLALRKSKKAAVTETVINGAIAEANKLGWTLEKFLIEWCTRGSQGLKAEWIAPKQNPADIVRLTVPASNEPDPALEKIKQDEKVTRPPTPEERAILNAYRRKA